MKGIRRFRDIPIGRKLTVVLGVITIISLLLSGIFLSATFWIQERKNAIVELETVAELIGANGVGVVVEAQHLCMMMRGVEKQNSYAITSALLGPFRDDQRTRSEFLDLIRHRRTS